MLRTRIITGLILGALLLLGIFLLPRVWVILCFGALFTLAAWEWAGFGPLEGTWSRAGYAAATAVLLWAAWIVSADPRHLEVMLKLACAWWAVAFLWLTLAPGWHRRALTLFCGLLVLAPAFVALMRVEVSSSRFAQGPLMVLWLIVMVVSADVGAYFAGRAFGRHKLAPRVSPGKTWEGALGGLLAVSLAAAAGAALLSLSVSAAMALGCGVGIFSVIGDLTESMFKRAAALKDSSNLLPGHGGLLDRLDSVTAAAPLYALGLFGSGVIS